MRVATQGPFAVGIVRWQWPTPGISVVVKITYRLDRNGRAEPSPTQLGLCVDSQGIGVGDELEYPSDFAPLKARCDVLVVGHARATTPAASLPVEVCVDDYRKAVQVAAATPTAAMLLSAGSMRCEGGVAGLGPRRVTASGWRQIHSLHHYDFGQFNVAPADQQLPHLHGDSRLVLSGLFEGASRRDVQLGGLEPEVFYLSGEDQRATARGVALRCDTLWIHTDRRLCTLTWRGLVESAPETDSAARLITVVRGAHPRSPQSVAAEAVDGAWKAPVDRYGIRPGPPAERHLAVRGGAPLSAAAPPAAPVSVDLPAGAQNGGTAVLARPPSVAPASEAFEDEDMVTGQLDWPAKHAPGEPGPESEPGHMATDQIDWSPDQDTVDQAPVLPSPGQPDPPKLHDEPLKPPLAKAGSSSPAAPAGMAGDGIYDDDEQEPGPVTPSAGVQLGGMMGGGGLGSMVLTSPSTSKAPLPFDEDEAAASGDGGPRRRTAPPPDDEALPFRQDTPSSAAAPPFVPAPAGVPAEPPSEAGDTLPDDEESPQSVTGEVQIGGEKPVLPFQPGESRPPPASPAKRVGTGTVSLPAFPPLAAQPPPGAKAKRVGTGTVSFPTYPRDPKSTAPLPFDGLANPSAPGATADPPAPAEPPALADPPPQPVAQSVVPSIVPSAPWHPPPIGAPPADVDRSTSPAADGGHTESGESHPAKRAGLDLPLETYATIKAQLWDGSVPAEEVLKEYALDEPKWRAIEAKQARAIARDAATGRAQLAIDVRNAIAEARRKLTVDEPEQTELDIEQFAQLLVAVEDAPNEAALLAEHEIEPAEWERLQRHWGQRASTDRQLAEELRTQIAKARRALRDGSAAT